LLNSARTDAVLDRDTRAPGRVLLAVAVSFCKWRLLQLLLAVMAVPQILEPVAVLGRFTLSSYMLLLMIVLPVPWTGGRQPSHATATLTGSSRPEPRAAVGGPAQRVWKAGTDASTRACGVARAVPGVVIEVRGWSRTLLSALMS